jgi:hypothetical protein
VALARSVFGVDILNCVVFNGRIGDSIGSSSGDPLRGTLRDEKPIENNDFVLLTYSFSLLFCSLLSFGGFSRFAVLILSISVDRQSPNDQRQHHRIFKFHPIEKVRLPVGLTLSLCFLLSIYTLALVSMANLKN